MQITDCAMHSGNQTSHYYLADSSGNKKSFMDDMDGKNSSKRSRTFKEKLFGLSKGKSGIVGIS